MQMLWSMPSTCQYLIRHPVPVSLADRGGWLLLGYVPSLEMLYRGRVPSDHMVGQGSALNADMDLRGCPKRRFLIGANQTFESSCFCHRKQPTDMGRTSRHTCHIEDSTSTAFSRLIPVFQITDMQTHRQIIVW